MKYLLYYILFSFIIIVFAYINSKTIIENFTPVLREYYRPIVRDARVKTEGFYNKTSSDISNLFRKIGIM